LSATEAKESFENNKIVSMLEKPNAIAIGIPRNIHTNRAVNRVAIAII
jgi:hypothetical protein